MGNIANKPHASILPRVLPDEHPVQPALLSANYQRRHLLAGSEQAHIMLIDMPVACASAALQPSAFLCCIAQICCLKKAKTTGLAAYVSNKLLWLFPVSSLFPCKGYVLKSKTHLGFVVLKDVLTPYS